MLERFAYLRICEDRRIVLEADELAIGYPVPFIERQERCLPERNDGERREERERR